MARWRNEQLYNREIAAAHAQFPAIPVAVIKAVIGQESGFVLDARRPEPQLNDASHGLMQLLLRTARGLGFDGTVDQLYNAFNNIYYGTKLLNQLWGQLGSWDAVFSAYNGGLWPALGFGAVATKPLRVCLARDRAGTCTSWRDVPPGEYSNQPYVDGVKRRLAYFEGAGAAPGGGASLVLPVVLLAALAFGAFR